ncbi:MAG: hypothetical protein ABSC94_23245 [Polyangiaceae bacterium]
MRYPIARVASVGERGPAGDIFQTNEPLDGGVGSEGVPFNRHIVQNKEESASGTPPIPARL